MQKKELGIDLSALSSAQKKMCVQLLAQSNINVDQKQNQYVATFTVTSDRIKQLEKKKIEPPQKKSQKTVKSHSRSTYIEGKKPLSRTLRLSNLQRLQTIHPYIEIYIYPKRLSLSSLFQVIQNLYYRYTTYIKQEKKANFMDFFYESLKKTGKGKVDQILVNIIQSINYYEHRNKGVKLFRKFLGNCYSEEPLSYFIVIRSLLQEIISEKILDFKKKSTYLTDFYKIKWNPYEGQMIESSVREFLCVSCVDKDIDEVFERLTQVMYYNEERKINCIQVFDLLQFLIEQFIKPSESISEPLELSYSRDDRDQSTLNELFFQSSNANQGVNEIFDYEDVNYHLELKEPAEEKNEQNVNTLGDELIKELLEKVTDICSKMGIETESRRKIRDQVKLCGESIIQGDKRKWINTIEIQGKEAQLFYIEKLQQQFRQMDESMKSPLILNSFTKKIINGPGIRSLISSFIML